MAFSVSIVAPSLCLFCACCIDKQEKPQTERGGEMR